MGPAPLIKMFGCFKKLLCGVPSFFPFKFLLSEVTTKKWGPFLCALFEVSLDWPVQFVPSFVINENDSDDFVQCANGNWDCTLEFETNVKYTDYTHVGKRRFTSNK